MNMQNFYLAFDIISYWWITHYTVVMIYYYYFSPLFLCCYSDSDTGIKEK